MRRSSERLNLLIIFRARRKRKREAFGVVEHNDGLSTDDEQNKLETTKFNTTHGKCLVYHVHHLSSNGKNLLVIVSK